MKKVINVCALTDNSPRIDAGTNITVSMYKDISRNNRIIDSAIDVGCYEVVPTEEN